MVVAACSLHDFLARMFGWEFKKGGCFSFVYGTVCFCLQATLENER